MKKDYCYGQLFNAAVLYFFTKNLREISCIRVILESHKKVKNLFIALKARQILHKTTQRALSTM